MAYHEIQPPERRSQASNSTANVESEFGFLRVLLLRAFTPENLISYGLLALILVAAAGVRFVAARQGLPYLTVHDEPELAGTAIRMIQTGDFNPHYFNYGSLMMYVSLGVDVLHYFYLLGQPAHAPDFIRSLDQLVMGVGDYRWSVSHPSFFLWNRWVVGLMGTASVALVFGIGRMLLNRWAGLIGAAFLATTLFHVEHSALITNDVPVSFLVLLAAFFSLLYLKNMSSGYLVTALAFCGLATACKYNAALSMIFPFFAFGLSFLMHIAKARSGYRHWLWIALFVVPPIFFLIGMPYALLDLPEFLLGAGWEVVHYKHLGHGADTVERGLPYFLFQAKQFRTHLGIVGLVAALLGVAFFATKRLGWLLLIFPLFYLFYMSTMIVSFHRNFLLLYPIAAIAVGCGVGWIGQWVLRRIHILAPRLRQPLMIVFALLLIGFFAMRFMDAAQFSRNVSRQPETRTAMIDHVNKLISEAGDPNSVRVGIASELHVHPQDLRRLAVAPTIAPHLTLVDNFAAYDVVVSGKTFVDGTASTPAVSNTVAIPDAAALNKATSTLPPPTDLLAGREAVFLADWPIINPTLVIYTP